MIATVFDFYPRRHVSRWRVYEDERRLEAALDGYLGSWFALAIAQAELARAEMNRKRLEADLIKLRLDLLVALASPAQSPAPHPRTHSDSTSAPPASPNAP